MAKQTELSKREEERLRQEEVLEQRRRQKKRARAKGRRKDRGMSLNLNSMMDMMTIILCFLLKSYGEEPLTILAGVDVPFSTSETGPQDMTTITISDDALIVIDHEVLKLTPERQVDPKFKKSGTKEDLIIKPLLDDLLKKVEEQKNFAQRTKTEFKGELIIIADAKTPYRLVTEVIQTSLNAEFTKFHFAILKGNMEFSGTSTADPARQ